MTDASCLCVCGKVPRGCQVPAVVPTGGAGLIVLDLQVYCSGCTSGVSYMGWCALPPLGTQGGPVPLKKYAFLPEQHLWHEGDPPEVRAPAS
eukprot:1012393-Prorocentrum_minimum.AAC.2